MTIQEVKNLNNGDEVFWTDPEGEISDDNNCSKVIKIAKISLHGEIIRITGVAGDELECFASELT